VSSSLDWYPPKGSPAPHPSGRLRLATWNVENLHAQDGQSTSLEPDPSVKRTATDGDRIRCYVRLFDPDILAVQEVDGEEALSRVVDTDVYDVHVDDRPKGSLNGQQNTGFAFKRGLTVVRPPDFEALDIRGNASLRCGAWVDLTHNGQTVQLMSVHLKSGRAVGQWAVVHRERQGRAFSQRQGLGLCSLKMRCARPPLLALLTEPMESTPP
jgi:endonuclease/exonuclease/phosphatase family metal-dependent hydrolase